MYENNPNSVLSETNIEKFKPRGLGIVTALLLLSGVIGTIWFFLSAENAFEFSSMLSGDEYSVRLTEIFKGDFSQTERLIIDPIIDSTSASQVRISYLLINAFMDITIVVSSILLWRGILSARKLLIVFLSIKFAIFVTYGIDVITYTEQILGGYTFLLYNIPSILYGFALFYLIVLYKNKRLQKITLFPKRKNKLSQSALSRSAIIVIIGFVQFTVGGFVLVSGITDLEEMFTGFAFAEEFNFKDNVELLTILMISVMFYFTGTITLIVGGIVYLVDRRKGIKFAVPKYESVNINRQTIYAMIPFFDWYAAFKVKKFWMFILIIFGVGIAIIPIDEFVLSNQEPYSTLIYYVIEIPIAIFLIRRWSQKWNQQFDGSNTTEQIPIEEWDD